MRASRPAACAALVLTFLLTSPAGAAPRCRLLTDPVGDTGVQDEHVDGYGADVDIVSADVASGRTQLAAVVRVRDMDSADPAEDLQGRRYEVHFSASRTHHFSLVAQLGNPRAGIVYQHEHGWTSPDEERAGVMMSSWTRRLADATVSVDDTRAEVRITVPLTTFRLAGVTLRRGTRLDDFAAVTGRSWGDVEGSPVPSSVETPMGFEAYPYTHPGNAWDVVNGPKTAYYRLGERSCVRVG